MVTSSSNPPARAPGFLRILHLYTLSGFAVAQPALASLAGQSVYLHDQNFGKREIILLLIYALALLPLIWVAADQIVIRVTNYFHCPGRNVVIGLLAGLVIMTFVRPYIGLQAFCNNGLATYTEFAIAILFAIAFMNFYERLSWIQSWLNMASIGLLVFPATFLFQFQAIAHEKATLQGAIHAQNPVNVVVIVFDELSGVSLFNSQNEIDDHRFPQFARLAKMSTCYRRATTVNPRTDIAVPSILSGRYPVVDRNPLESEYPGNLFQIIEATRQFEMLVFEPITRLCPESVRCIPKFEQSFFSKLWGLISTVTVVYPRLILPSDAPIDFPTIPVEWFGQHPLSYAALEVYESMPKGLFHYSGTESRRKQLAHFLRCLNSPVKPRFSFLHLVCPHFPWCFLPSGEQYLSEVCDTNAPPGGVGELGEDWEDDSIAVARNEYRYQLQLGFIDRFIGQMLDCLQANKQIDDCLLIVTADHGVSFRPGNSRRLPGKDNVADILSVPLFIKFPGQKKASFDDRNVELIDLYPTIAETLGIELPTAVDGISVLQETRHPRKTFYFQEKSSILEPDFPQRESAIKYQVAKYQTDSIGEIPVAAIRFPDWNGRRIESFEIQNGSVPYIEFLNQSLLDNRHPTPKCRLSPNLIWGNLVPEDLNEPAYDILLVVDGVVTDSTRTSRTNRFRNIFEFVRPPEALKGNTEKIELYLVQTINQRTRLTRLEAKGSRDARREDD